jgi:hypothetical protein
MAKFGILAVDEQVELIARQIIQKMPKALLTVPCVGSKVAKLGFGVI